MDEKIQITVYIGPCFMQFAKMTLLLQKITVSIIGPKAERLILVAVKAMVCPLHTARYATRSFSLVDFNLRS